MISQTAEYALRAVVLLATYADTAKTNREIAEGTHVPPPYLSKVLRSLARAGIVGSHRGLYGGFFLLKDPAEITLYEVVNAVEPILRIKTCPMGHSSHSPNLCALHRVLDASMAEVEARFRATTLAAVIGENGETIPLCDGREIPRARLTERGRQSLSRKQTPTP